MIKSDVHKETPSVPFIDNSNTSSYRSIFKATSLFGGLQVYQILIGIIKSKFVAILLGPAGMGIMGLYQSTLDLIKSVSAFGLESSAVRDISEANGSKNELKIATIIASMRKLVWLTGALGLVITLVLAPLLSRLTFGNGDYTWGFVLLSVTLLINQISAGQRVLLQGMRRLRDLAKASAIGATVGLIISVPLYYWIGPQGIVPTIVAASLSSMALSWFYARKVKTQKVNLTLKQAFSNGQSMIRMGIAMSISSILVTLFAYILRWFIRKQGGVDAVGVFSAGFMIVNTYVGMVFTAMGTDYYPRLAAVNSDNERCKEVINQQGEVAVLILAPLAVSCIIFMPLIIRIIYSESFLSATDYISWAILGMMFKAASYVVAYLILAKADSRVFIYNETFSNIRSLIFNIVGFYLWGLAGLGIAFLVNNVCYLVQVFFIAKKRYNFSFQPSFINVFIPQFALVVVCFVITKLWESNYSFLILAILFIISTIYSLIELNKKMNIVVFLKHRLNSK